jgi:hypothetical protein
MERDERDADIQAKRSERRQTDDLERALDDLAKQARDLAKQARDLARDALSAAGYHQHRRGEWRNRRVSRNCEGTAHRADHG